MSRLLTSLALGSLLTIVSVASAQDQLQAERALPAGIQDLRLDSPMELSGLTAADIGG